MKGKQLFTYDDLKENVGKKIICVIRGKFIEDCLISFERDKVYLLQDKEHGLRAIDLKGYKYSWGIKSGDDFDDDFVNLSDIFLVEQQPVEEYYTLDIETLVNSKAPSWLKDKAVLCYVSNDDSDIIDMNNKRYVYGYNPHSNSPYMTIGDNRSLNIINKSVLDSYKHAVPVKKPNKEERLKEVEELVKGLTDDKLERLLRDLRGIR